MASVKQYLNQSLTVVGFAFGGFQNRSPQNRAHDTMILVRRIPKKAPNF